MFTLKRFVFLASIVWLAACQPARSLNRSQSAAETDSLAASPLVAQAKVPRETSPNVMENTLSELIAGNNAFAFDLYQTIRSKETGNLFYSPYSISVALAMTYAGSRSATAQQMADTLHYTLPQEQLHPAFNALDLQLAPDNRNEQEPDEGNFNLQIANSIWGQSSHAFRPEYLDLIARHYGSELRLVDFKNQDKRMEARLAINDWVSQRTEGKIEELIEKGILKKKTRLVLANAIYFKAEWETPFLSGTRDETFTLLDGEQITVPMMSRRANTSFAEGEGYQAIEIPYKGDRMRMVILLPAPGQFEAFESSLDRESLDTILQSLSPRDMKLFMPKFEYDASLNLAETLAELGMPDAFNPGRADFSGMDGTRFLFIKHVIHKAFVAVDEIGTEAAAATGVAVEIVSEPTVVKVDRPFVFVIRDSQSGAILFIGRMVNPAT